MRLSRSQLWIVLRTSCLGLTVVGLTNCDKTAATAPAEQPRRFVYVAPPPPLATHVPEGMGQWLDLLHDLQQQISAVESQLHEASAVHRDTAFDDLLKLDLNTLGNDQLAYLWHFAEKGYFTLDREIMVKLLEDQESRPAISLAEPGNIAARAQVLVERYESHLRDLQLAVAMYAKTKEVAFHIPNHLDAEQTDILKGMVAEQLSRARDECITLDIRIEQLQHRTKADEANEMKPRRP